MMRLASGRKRVASPLPIAPKPTTATVRSSSERSVRIIAGASHLLSVWAANARGSWRKSASSIATACSATAGPCTWIAYVIVTPGGTPARNSTS